MEIRICIVEDELESAIHLKDYISKYGVANHKQLRVTHLKDGLDLVDDYHGQYDIILLDIQMKYMDGMSTAQKIREMDPSVILIFITSTVQYAVQGYTVDALGYVLKPVPYTAFSQLMDKATTRVEAKQEKTYIRVNMEEKQLKLDCDTVSYIESQRNNVIIHTEQENYVTAGPLKRFEESLSAQGFIKCHNAYLVNLSFVSALLKEAIELSTGERLPISRAKKKEFMAALAENMD